MAKLFEAWNTIKESTHNLFRNENFLKGFYVNPREIRYIQLGVNIGFEEDGKWYQGKECRRPVLVIKKIGGLYLIVPMTSVPKEDNKFYHIITNDQAIYYEEAAKREKSGLILSQIRVIDKSRFIHKIAELSEDEFSIIKEKLKTLLF